MKKNFFKSVFVAALATATISTGCVKNDGEKAPDSGTRTVQISIKKGASRTIGGQVVNGTTVTFESGKLLFVNGVDLITMIVNIMPGSAEYDASTKKVGIETLESTGGAWITGVPGASTKVYFIGNVPAGMATPLVNGNVNDFAATVSSQWKADGGVGNVTIWGGEVLTQYTGAGAEADQYKAKFQADAIASRFEICDIEKTGDVTAYKIDGIFIDYYYNSMKINNSVVTAADLVTNGAVIPKYAQDGPESSYTTTMLGHVYDYDATSGLTKPTAGNAWAYNLLAPKTTGAAMPKIVIRLSGVEVNGEPWPSPQFLTIGNFYTDDTNTSKIESLDPGRVYRIPSVDFSEKDLTPQPQIKTKRVLVEVDLMEWEVKTIGFDFE